MESKKFLFANVPADGHFGPLTRLAVHLKNQGHDVRWYAQELYRPRIERLGIPYYPFVTPPQVNQLNFEAHWPERATIKSQVGKLKFDLEQVFIRRSTEYYEDIKEIHKEFPFDIFIADMFFTGIPLVKEKLNVPAIAIGVVPVTETSKDLPPAGLGILPSKNIIGKIKESFLRWLTDQFVFNSANKLFRTILKENGVILPKGNVFDILTRNASLVLQNGTPHFEYPRTDWNPNLHFVGPLLPYNEKKKDKYELPDKYKHFHKKILVTQGTVEKDVEKIIEPALKAFEHSDILIIVTTGGSKTKEMKAKYPAPNILIEDFIPFDDIMPICDAFVTNGGYGGVLMSIYNKLPLVVAGVHEGKNEINARVGYFKIGINLKTEKPTPSQIKDGVEEVLKDKSYKSRVTELAEEFAKYNPMSLSEKYISELLIEKGQIRNQVPT